MKKHIKKFEGYRSNTEQNEFKPINELVVQMEDCYEVTVSVKVPFKVVSSYCKKVEQNTTKKLTAQYGEAMIAEKLVYYVIEANLDPEKIPASALTGVQGQAQGQAQMPQTQTQDQTQTQGQPQVQVTEPNQGQVQSAQTQPAQSNDDDLPI